MNNLYAKQDIEFEEKYKWLVKGVFPYGDLERDISKIRKEVEEKVREEERVRIRQILVGYFKNLVAIPDPQLTKESLFKALTK